jgi:hypothetical protein
LNRTVGNAETLAKLPAEARLRSGVFVEMQTALNVIKIIVTVLNVVVSLTLISFLFAAIYKILPDRDCYGAILP